MAELEFCPFCSTQEFKIARFPDNVFFCKGCNRFFTFEEKTVICQKCKKGKMALSDFPTPDGQLVLQCTACKKMITAREYFGVNNGKK